MNIRARRNNMLDENVGKLNNVYSSSQIPILEQPDYKNNGNLVHNNIGKNILSEQEINNVVFIDTDFRNTQYYPHPFKFDVKFNGIMGKTETIKTIVDGIEYSYVDYVDGDVQIVIPKDFKNVIKVKINAIVLPINIDYIEKCDGSYVISDRKLNCEKYIIVKIKELTTLRKWSNNPLIDNNSIIMVQDTTWGECNEYWTPVYEEAVSFESKLENVTRLSFEIYKSNGTPINITLNGNQFNPIKEYKDLITKIKNNELDPHSDPKIIPRLNSLKKIVLSMYPEIHITITTLEPQLNTLPKYN